MTHDPVVISALEKKAIGLRTTAFHAARAAEQSALFACSFAVRSRSRSVRSGGVAR
ncbi:hypothetical protein [Streptosporangium sp. CA-115845]|uniref:hypothetical protein n=1 Tax=Streptosporangium sp. CA-115845 TaxID=3240071 RepID=UPI003D9245E4